jgi:RNA polymerase sigma factor (sigma-70 family)
VTRRRRDQLITEHLEIPRVIARAVASKLPRGVDLRDELHAEALRLLVEAAENFEPRRGVPFDGYARWLISRRIYDMIRRRRLKDARLPHIEDLTEAEDEHEADHLAFLGVAPDQESRTELALLRRKIRRRLDGCEQNVIELHYSGGLSHSAISRKTGIQPKRVKAIHLGALRKLAA